MTAGREVTDSRDNLLEEIRSARARQHTQVSELQRQQANAVKLTRAREVDSVQRRRLASEEALVAKMSQELHVERSSLESVVRPVVHSEGRNQLQRDSSAEGTGGKFSRSGCIGSVPVPSNPTQFGTPAAGRCVHPWAQRFMSQPCAPASR
eukprot:478740-Amphidinium_carterae.1